MTKKLKLTFREKKRACHIEIGEGLLISPELIEKTRTLGNQAAIITDSTTKVLFGASLQWRLENAGLPSHVFAFPSGEINKTRRTKEILEDSMQAKGLGRDTVLLALGGGVVTDIGGFIASTYCRGIPYISLPTTLLGMVDASIGGKTGVDTPAGKNLIGTIYQPESIFMDLSTLKHLPASELKNGFAEMIKHGLIADTEYFARLEAQAGKLLNLNIKLLQKAIYESCKIKMSIVREDEKESGKRRLLNFGHTVGHAIELSKNYSLPHGEAVALGCIAESDLSMKAGYLDQQSVERIRALFLRYGFPERMDTVTPKGLIEAMSLDKKSSKGKPRFVMLKSIGMPVEFDAQYCSPVDEELLRSSLKEIIR